jgi:hypothetical protein
MADNVGYTEGSGKTIAADDVGGVLHQRVKLSIGADGSAADVSAANPLPAVDSGAAWAQSYGVSGAAFVSADASAITAITDAPTTGQKLVIDDIFLSVGSTAMQVDFKLETAGTILLPSIYALANSFYQITPRGKLKLATADKRLMIDTSVAGNVSVTVFYHSEL